MRKKILQATALIIIGAIIFTLVIINLDKPKSRPQDILNSYDWTKFPKQPQKISWNKVEALFAAEKVISASQSHSLSFSILTKDYKYYTSTEPKNGDIWNLVKKYDPNHEKILFSTE